MQDPGDRKEFAGLVAMLAMNFRQEVGETLFEVMWLGLSDLTIAQFRTAAQKAVRKCKFMPTVAELREFVVEKPQPAYYLPWKDPSKNFWRDYDRRVAAGEAAPWPKALPPKGDS